MENNRKNNRRKKITGLILAGIVLFAICFEVINTDYLQELSFAKKFRWETPVSVAANEDGYIGVIDSAGTRISIVSPKGKVIETIEYSMFRNVSPVCEDSIAVSDDSVIVVDHVASSKHSAGYYDRILEYDFKGKYVDTPYTDKHEENVSIYSVAVHKDITYVTAAEYGKNNVIVGKLKDKSIEKIHQYQCNYSDVFGVRYNPASDTTTVLKNNGDIVYWKGDEDTEIPLSESDVVMSDAVTADDGTLVAVNSNDDAVFAIKSADSIKKLATTEALNISDCGNKILYADQNENSIGIIDRTTGETTLIKDARYSSKITILSFLTWLILFIGILALILLIIIFVMSIADLLRASKQKAESADLQEEHDKPITNIQLYGPIMGVAALAFAITAIMIGSMFYNSAMESSKMTVSNVSSTVMRLSGETFGDCINNINSQNDFGNADYIKATANVAAACENNRTVAGLAQINYSLYKFKTDSDEIMVIYDYYGQMKTGTILSSSDQKNQDINKVSGELRKGKSVQSSFTYSNGVEYYESFSPVFDSDGEIAGFTVININQTKVKEKVLHQIMIKVIEAFTLLFGLVLLIIEFALFGKFVRLKRKRDREGQVKRTVPEAFRTMDVVFRIPAALFIIFIYSMVEEVLDHRGIQETILLVALPITIYAVTFFVFRIIAGLYVKFSPKGYAYTSAIWTAGASLILLFAMKQESYLLLNVGAVAIGISSAVGMISAKSIRLTMVASTRFKYIAIERKGLIATAIAASLGTVLRTLFGKTAIVYFLIFIALLAVVAAYMLMEDDISLSEKKKKNRKSVKQIIYINRRMIKRPNIFVFMILVALPMPFLTLLGTYVLPQVNSYYGFPEVFIGAISIVVSVISLLLSSFLWRTVDTKSDEHWPPLFLGIMAVILLLFSLITTMGMFVFALIIIALCESILTPMALRFLIKESNESGLDARDTSPMHELFIAIGTMIGPVIMTAMMMLNVKLIGIVWGLVCLACAVAAHRLISKEEK